MEVYEELQIVFLFDVSVSNAFILHSYDVTSTVAMEQKHFRLMLAVTCSAHPPRLSPARQRTNIPTVHTSALCGGVTRKVVCRDAERTRTLPRTTDSLPRPVAPNQLLSEPTLCLTGKSDNSDCFRLWHEQ